ncbi:MAG TPA: FimV/HubP family polar landmark protein [Gallionella sp.]|nr:FimV/HubP family polar landmark protein [Gallionella sp.]
MRKPLLKLLGVVVALSLSAQAAAVGLGGINVTSALGQTLRAEIELVAVTKADKASLVARLALPEAYQGAGLEYPSGNKFQFQLVTHPDGRVFLKVSSAQPINDPFVSLLVELSWSSGRLMREYTFLLDPPGYVPEQPKAADVKAVAPTVQPGPAVEAVAKAAEPAAPAAAAPTEKRVSAEKKTLATAPASQPRVQIQAKPKTRTAKATAGSIKVKRGDTLNSISARHKPAAVSLERMLVAVYRANARQFDGNMNRIKVGKVLRLPGREELAQVTQPDAAMEIRAQADEWHTYRQKLAGAVPAASHAQPARQAVGGKITTAVADQTAVAREPAKDVLRLSKGEAPGDRVGAGAIGKTVNAQEARNAAQETAISRAQAVRDEQQRAALLEKNIKDAQRLAELKAKADTQSKGASPIKTAAAPGAGASLTDRMTGEPAVYLAGFAAAALGLGGLGLLWNSSRSTSRRQPGPAGDAATGDAGCSPEQAAELAQIQAELDRVVAQEPDLKQDLPAEGGKANKPAPVVQGGEDLLAGIDLNLNGVVPAKAITPEPPREEHWHEVATKLDLARAYQEMGDIAGARIILNEVLQEGDVGQREAAQTLLKQLA